MKNSIDTDLENEARGTIIVSLLASLIVSTVFIGGVIAYLR